MDMLEKSCSEEIAAKPKKLVGVRHVQTVMLFLALVLAYALRVNMSVAVVAMTDPASDVYFEWSVQIQSVLLSSFFWGYVVLQIPGGILAARLGGKRLLLISIVCNGLFTLLIPPGAYYGGWLVVLLCRILQGLTQAFVYPATYQLVSKWIPLEEKARLAGLIYAGSHFGTALQLVVSGYIASSWGWESMFYSLGALCLVWGVIYMIIGADSPQQSKVISEEERAYIQTSLGHVGGHEKLSTPWRKIWTSLPFWALIVAHCGQNWGFWTLLTEMPSYMSQVLGVDIKKNGVLSSLPYFALVAVSVPVGALSDLAINRKWVSVTSARKMANSMAKFVPALSLIALSYSPAGDVSTAVLLLTVTLGFNAGHLCGFMLVHTDMAPNFSSEMMGITNFFANLVSLAAPLAVGFILEDETDPVEWRTVFFLSSAVFAVCNTFFLLFGTSKEQTWNQPQSHSDAEHPLDSKVTTSATHH